MVSKKKKKEKWRNSDIHTPLNYVMENYPSVNYSLHLTAEYIVHLLLTLFFLQPICTFFFTSIKLKYHTLYLRDFLLLTYVSNTVTVLTVIEIQEIVIYDQKYFHNRTLWRNHGLLMF